MTVLSWILAFFVDRKDSVASACLCRTPRKMHITGAGLASDLFVLAFSCVVVSSFLSSDLCACYERDGLFHDLVPFT